MQESNDRRPDSGKEADATSKETLRDVEENENSSAGTESGEAGAGVASPDGAFDEGRETDDAGPM